MKAAVPDATSVPYPCQNGWKTAVSSGRLAAPRTACDLDTRRLTTCLKRPSSNWLSRRRIGVVGHKRARCRDQRTLTVSHGSLEAPDRCRCIGRSRWVADARSSRLGLPEACKRTGLDKQDRNCGLRGPPVSSSTHQANGLGPHQIAFCYGRFPENHPQPGVLPSQLALDE